jgi:ADP-heptose:LPS heptosyltransferase
LHPGISDPNRTWPKEHWEELARLLLAQGHDVYWIGSRGCADNRSVLEVDVKGVIDLRDTNDLLATVVLMRYSDLLVSCDGGPIQLAGSTDIGIVGIYSVVPGKDRLPYRRGKIGWHAKSVEPDCQHFPCYYEMKAPWPKDLGKHFREWCPETGYTCMKRITPQIVFDACMEVLSEI